MKIRFKIAIVVFVLMAGASAFLDNGSFAEHRAAAQCAASTTPTPQPFDQAAAIAKLKEQIKGRENEPATAVFKNIQTMKNTPAGRLLAVMEMGFARSLGVNCTHCHVADKWEVEDKPQKQIARDMSAMVSTINRDLLKNVKNLKSESPIVNCTTCHRGEIKPALNLATR
jgi:hypothetical protein